MTDILSINAVQDCMADLGLSNSDENRHLVDASLFNPSNRSFGSIRITFCSNWHSGDGPYIEVGNEIKSFGISFLSFKPAWQTFVWDSLSKKLSVSGDGYKFILEFEK